MSLQLKHGTSSLMQPLRSIPSTWEPILMVSLQIFQRPLIDIGIDMIIFFAGSRCLNRGNKTPDYMTPVELD
ncbi:hypothetical protein V6N13_073745 [Hibiscus sabdariffa]